MTASDRGSEGASPTRKFVRPPYISRASFFVQVLLELFWELVLIPIGIANPPEIEPDYYNSAQYHQHSDDAPRSDAQTIFVVISALVIAYCGFVLMERGTGTPEMNLIVTFVVAATGGFQALYMKRQWSVMSQQLQIAQRAWIAVATPKTLPLNEGWSTDNLTVWLRNIGKTPAIIHIVESDIFAIPAMDLSECLRGIIEDFMVASSHGRESRMNLAPDARRHIKPICRKPIDIGDAISGDTELFLVVYIAYRDVFKKNRTTQACFRLDTNTNCFWVWYEFNDMD